MLCSVEQYQLWCHPKPYLSVPPGVRASFSKLSPDPGRDRLCDHGGQLVRRRLPATDHQKMSAQRGRALPAQEGATYKI